MLCQGAPELVEFLAADSGHERCVLELIKVGAAIDATDKTGCTALIHTALNGHERCLLEILKAGAAIDQTNGRGRLDGSDVRSPERS